LAAPSASAPSNTGGVISRDPDGFFVRLAAKAGLIFYRNDKIDPVRQELCDPNIMIRIQIRARHRWLHIRRLKAFWPVSRDSNGTTSMSSIFFFADARLLRVWRPEHNLTRNAEQCINDEIWSSDGRTCVSTIVVLQV
jgi:hypothetical protein